MAKSSWLEWKSGTSRKSGAIAIAAQTAMGRISAV
jgi:hypothetical protein